MTHSPVDSPRLERAQLRRLHWISLVEATTLVVLVGVAVPLKHLAGVPVVSAVVGPVHGLAFLAYCWTAVQTVAGGGWTGREVGWLAVAALVPFGGFTLGPLLRQKAARAATGEVGAAPTSPNG